MLTITDDGFDFIDETDEDARSAAGVVSLLDDDDDDRDDDDDDDDDPDDNDRSGDDDGDDLDDDDDRDDDGSDDDLDDDGRTDIDFEDALTIAYLYEAGLNRNGEIDEPGLNFWIDVFEFGAPLDEIAEDFLDSDEFEDAFGDPDDLDDRTLVELCYRNILDRDGDPDGIDFWTAALGDDDFDDADLLLAFAESVENIGGLDLGAALRRDDDGEWIVG